MSEHSAPEFTPHSWLFHRDREDGIRSYRCSGCKRFTAVNMAVPSQAFYSRMIDAAAGGPVDGEFSRCGFPSTGEDWKAGGVRGYVTAVDRDSRTFWIKPYDGGGGEAREFPWGTPDETPVEAEATP